MNQLASDFTYRSSVNLRIPMPEGMTQETPIIIPPLTNLVSRAILID